MKTLVASLLPPTQLVQDLIHYIPIMTEEEIVDAEVAPVEDGAAPEAPKKKKKKSKKSKKNLDAEDDEQPKPKKKKSKKHLESEEEEEDVSEDDEPKTPKKKKSVKKKKSKSQVTIEEEEVDEEMGKPSAAFSTAQSRQSAYNRRKSSVLAVSDDPFAPREGKTLLWRNVNMTLVSFRVMVACCPLWEIELSTQPCPIIAFFLVPHRNLKSARTASCWTMCGEKFLSSKLLPLWVGCFILIKFEVSL